MKRGDLQSNGLPPNGKSGGGSEPRPSHVFDAAAELELIDAVLLLDDKKAFSDLFERYRSDLYALCFQRLNDHSLAEDVVQEAFIRVLTHLPTFDRSKRFWPWLATIAVRMCTDLQRRRSFTHYSGDIEVSLDNGVHKDALERQTGPAPDAVIASEEREEFLKSLDVLPKRQRRAFVLFTLDGLSCADIAAAEGVSVGAVHRLLYRARNKLRAARQSGPLPAIVFPFAWLGWKLQRIGERIRMVLGVYSDGFSSACLQTVCLGTVVAMVVATGNTAEPFDGNDAGRSGETVIPANILSSMQTRMPQAGSSQIAASAKGPAGSGQVATEAAGSPIDGVINPYESATPETATLQSLTPSPSYESDHTILAGGIFKGNKVLFVSHDGGAIWKPLPSRLLFGTAVVISPDYPQDRRIFAFGDLGLQQSDDEGETFRTVSPLIGWGFAISPSFGREDSRILIGASMVAGVRTMFVEYDADTGVTQPGLLSFPTSLETRNYFFVAFSPGYPSDPSVLVTAQQTEGQTILYRCKEVVCDEVSFPFNGPLKLRFSPQFNQDGLAYAFADKRLLVSNDGTRTFREVQFPFLDSGRIYDVAMLRNKSTDPAIFVSVYGFSPGIYRSFDAGRSWNKTPIDIPGFEYGAIKLIVTPTGRLLAVGKSYGIACSVDRGEIWTPRCPPEH